MNIVAIGGGEIVDDQTIDIDKHALDLTGAKMPQVLFVPTASSDSLGYIDNFQTYFRDRLGVKTDVLILTEDPSSAQVKDQISSANMVYVGGGNTRLLLELWNQYQLPEILKQKAEDDQNFVLAGLSAGAICWFEYGSTDSARFDDPMVKELVVIKGLGFVTNYLASPHHIREKEQREIYLPKLIERVGRTGLLGLAIDDQAAFVSANGEQYCFSQSPDFGVRVFDPTSNSYSALPVISPTLS